MAKMNWDKVKKEKMLAKAPNPTRPKGMVKVIDTKTGEVRWEKPKPAKYKPKPVSTAKVTIQVARTNNNDNVNNDKLIHKMHILEQIKEKQGFLNQKMQHELNRLKRALNKK